ncbi:hypothetical protein TRFO_23322 [Tritrichomonas foetus]|uniref:Uncharacterized protein n=1 Tax=Tritrichomonas foetus TaxID=1144522 RepID=A0A1J4KEL3_9EUKA|nr:hypothetical protein TRFO_23322 [Tritrichomonas foetus]|eukprot:OHT08188.1 hypothetical protein TRFO_23322 [Tritrichomonas foetus]
MLLFSIRFNRLSEKTFSISVMSSPKKAPISPPKNSTEMSETQSAIQNSKQGNLQNLNNSRNFTNSNISNLSQTAQMFDGMKQRYEGLMGMFSSQSSSESGLDSLEKNSIHHSISNAVNGTSSPTFIGDISSNFLVDENAEIEIQQWNIMWNHLISMISNIVPVNPKATFVKTGNERRAILVDLISKLCENGGINPKLNEDYNKLQKKYSKSKKLLQKLRAQGEYLMDEVRINKELLNKHLNDFSTAEDSQLSEKIRQLEELLRRQVERQTELLSIDLQEQAKQLSRQNNQKVPKNKPSAIRHHCHHQKIPRIHRKDNQIPKQHHKNPNRNKRNRHRKHNETLDLIECNNFSDNSLELFDERQNPHKNNKNHQNYRVINENEDGYNSGNDFDSEYEYEYDYYSDETSDDDFDYEEEDLDEIISKKNQQIRRIAKAIQRIEQRRNKKQHAKITNSNKCNTKTPKKEENVNLLNEIEEKIINHQKQQLVELELHKDSLFTKQTPSSRPKPAKIEQNSDSEIINEIEHLRNQAKKRKTPTLNKNRKTHSKAKTQIVESEDFSSSDNYLNKARASQKIPKTQPRPKRIIVLDDSEENSDNLSRKHQKSYKIHQNMKQNQNFTNYTKTISNNAKTNRNECNGKENHTKQDKKAKNNEATEIRRKFGNNVNQLVDVTNNLKNDYKRLKKVLGGDSNGSDLSIEQLSKIHDSLLSIEQKIETSSEE